MFRVMSLLVVSINWWLVVFVRFFVCFKGFDGVDCCCFIVEVIVVINVVVFCFFLVMVLLVVVVLLWLGVRLGNVFNGFFVLMCLCKWLFKLM